MKNNFVVRVNHSIFSFKIKKTNFSYEKISEMINEDLMLYELDEEELTKNNSHPLCVLLIHSIDKEGEIDYMIDNGVEFLDITTDTHLSLLEMIHIIELLKDYLEVVEDVISIDKNITHYQGYEV